MMKNGTYYFWSAENLSSVKILTELTNIGCIQDKPVEGNIIPICLDNDIYRNKVLNNVRGVSLKSVPSFVIFKNFIITHIIEDPNEIKEIIVKLRNDFKK